MSYALGWLLISGDVLWSVLLAYDSEHKLINGVARKMGTTILGNVQFFAHFDSRIASR